MKLFTPDLEPLFYRALQARFGVRLKEAPGLVSRLYRVRAKYPIFQCISILRKDGHIFLMKVKDPANASSL